jgi:hypothetical protein
MLEEGVVSEHTASVLIYAHPVNQARSQVIMSTK